MRRITKLVTTALCVAGATALVPAAAGAAGTPAGRVFTIAGTFVPPPGAANGALATRRSLGWVHTMLELPSGDVLVADSWRGIFRVGRDGRMTRFAGRQKVRLGREGARADRVGFGHLHDLARLPDGSILVAMDDEHLVRRIDRHRRVRTVAGVRRDAFEGWGGFSGDGGPATRAMLDTPVDLDVLPGGGYLIADLGANRVRRVSATGRITTVAGNGSPGHSGDGGPATQAAVDHPVAVAALPRGGFLIAEGYGDEWPRPSLPAFIRRVDPDGTIHTVVQLNATSLVADPAGGFYAAEQLEPNLYLYASGERIVHVDDAGVVTKVAGGPSRPLTMDEVTGAALAGRARVDSTMLAPTRDGGFLFADVNPAAAVDRVRYWAPSHPRRLAIGITTRTLASPPALRAWFELTRPARVVATVRTRGRIVRRSRGTFPAGLHAIAIGRAVKPGSYDVTLTAVSSRSRPRRVSDTVRVRPGGFLTKASALQALQEEGAVEEAIGLSPEAEGCRRMGRRRIDCPTYEGGVCQGRVATIELQTDGTVTRRDYDGCVVQRSPKWYPQHTVIP